MSYVLRRMYCVVCCCVLVLYCMTLYVLFCIVVVACYCMYCFVLLVLIVKKRSLKRQVGCFLQYALHAL